MDSQESIKSPYWNTTTKLVFGLTIVAIMAGIFLYYRSIVSLLILAFIITYLFRPVVIYLADKTKMSWRLSATLLFVLIIIILIGLLTGAGLAIAQQVTSLVSVLQDFAENLPELANDLTVYLGQFGTIGEIINLNDLANRALEAIQPFLGQLGSIVGTIATGAASSIGKLFFVVFVAYFILAESSQVGNISIEQIPQYDYDVRRMSRQLRIVWDSFFRGQIIIFMMVFVIYLIVLSVLGVRYSIALAAMTGLAVFVPYVGIWVTASVLFLVTFLQPTNYFGLLPWQYAALVLAITLVINFTFDNYITPRFLGRTLDIHPAAVLVAALVMASLLGIVGIFLAAPVVATLKLLGIYVFKKMFDLDPWPEPEVELHRIEFPWYRWSRQLVKWLKTVWLRVRKDKKD
ncbi:MAG: AI-2E family transporter [Anaerolineales bacterium]|nr:AI-2E family transporter [Anaerolineales bacterium]